MRRFVALAIFLLMLLTPILVSCKGVYHPPPTQRPSFEDIKAEAPVAGEFSEAYEPRKGTVLLDLSHENDFDPQEFRTLALGILSRGYTLEHLETAGNLEEKLRFADAFVIILPQGAFSESEGEKIKEFVEKGGKLILLGDATRPSEINSVAAEFKLMFEKDFLYNMHQYEGNFRNIFLSEFRDNEITRGLEQVVFYGAGSISSQYKGIIFTDDNTFSSVTETTNGFSPVALSEDSKVLAIADLTFMTSPLDSVFDNNQLISNIADWLTESRRVFVLSDFPYFFKGLIRIPYADVSLIDEALELKDSLVNAGKEVEVNEYQEANNKVSGEMLFIGFFPDAPKVETHLKGISIDDKVKIEGIGELPKEATAILCLDKSDDRHVLTVLADKEDTLKDALRLLKSGGFRDWLATDTLAIHQGPRSPTEASPEPEPEPEIPPEPEPEPKTPSE
ncbi:hypothetical protein ACFLVX_00245 [Chloroflexota bacterium]